jgi:thiamine-phosphate diphosphorylase
VTARASLLPRLHVVTDDDVLARPGFAAAAEVVLGKGPGLALHLRGRSVGARELLDLAQRLHAVGRETGARLLVNDRIDVALAAGLDGVQLGERSLPVQAARRLLPASSLVGASVHGVECAREAWSQGADYLIVGTIFSTPTHPGRTGRGVEHLSRVGAEGDGPVLAIGGITPARLALCFEAGAYGVAVLRGVWEAADPGDAVAVYMESLAHLTGEEE